MQDPILRPTHTSEGRSKADTSGNGDVKEIDIAELLALEYQGADFTTLRSVFKGLLGEMDSYPEKRKSKRKRYYDEDDIQYFTRSEVNEIFRGYKRKIYKRLRRLGVSWENTYYATNISPAIPSHTSAEELSKALTQYPIRMQRAVKIMGDNGDMLERDASLAISIHRMYEKVLGAIHFNGRFFVSDSERVKSLMVEIPHRRLKQPDWNKWGDSIFADD